MYRWVVLAVAAAALSISMTYRWRAHRAGGRIARRLEGQALILFRLLFALPLYASLVAYVIEPRWMAWSSFVVPPAVRWAAAALAVAVLPVLAWVFRHLGRNVSETVLTKEGQTLVTTGPYAWVRHPLYAAAGALLLAVGLVAANGFLLGLAGCTMAAVRYLVVPREERELAARFGAAYEAYRSRTGVFFPRMDVRL
jgi:protein-S-isoprenylcysteine O-methyltransferase Ste14